MNRAQIALTTDDLHAELGLPPEVEISSVEWLPARDLVVVHLADAVPPEQSTLPHVVSGSEAPVLMLRKHPNTLG